MRIRRLDLSRYGRFTDHSIDFGERIAGGSDLHIVYGPNEAGKSTALAGFLDLLFGIEARSRYGFLHPYPTMRIGACLELADGVHELVRIKRPQRSLLDGEDQPVSDMRLAGELGGITREAYRMMFSLDDETLEAGGESILASRGDLGQLLFSASAGLAELSRTLVELRSEADGFYRYRARSGELLQLKASLATLKQERETIDTLASAYAQLVESRDRASERYQEAIAEHSRIRSRADEIQRHLGVLPRLAALRQLRERLQPLADIPEAPPGWLDELPRLQAEEVELATRIEAVEAEIGQIASALEAIPVDPAALWVAARIGDLSEALARHKAAELDRPERVLHARRLELVIAGILGRLDRSGEADPGRLRIGAAIVGALREGIERRSGVEAAVEAAERELAEALQRLDAARAALADRMAFQGREPDPTLPAIVTALRGSDHSARRRLAERSCRLHAEILEERLAALHPWQGAERNDVEQLAVMAVPGPAEVDRWKTRLAQAEKQVERQQEAAERIEAERIHLEAGRLAADETVHDQEAGRLRAAREAAWAVHRLVLHAASADAFEAALRRDDIATNSRLRHEQERLASQQADRDLVLLKADLSRVREALHAAIADRQAVRDEVAGRLRVMTPSLAEDMTLARLDAWIGRRDQAMAARTQLRQAERDLRDALADDTDARETLSKALGLPWPGAQSFESLIAAAQSAIDLGLERKALRAVVEACEQEAAVRRRASDQASGADRAWQAAWAEACSACWLAERGAVPGVAAVREILAVLGDLGATLEQRSGLDERMRKLDREQLAFDAEVEAVARELGLDAGGGGTAALAESIRGRVQRAQAAGSATAARMEALNAAHERRRVLRERLAVHGRRKVEMTDRFGVGSLQEVGGRLQACALRAGLEQQALDARREILDGTRLPSIDAAITALDGADRPAMEVELSGLQARLEDLDQRTRDLFSTLARASDRIDAVGGDDAAARIETTRRTVLLEVEEKARRHLRLRAGIVAAEQALRLYRDRHRSSMLARGSDALRRISQGAYSGLATQAENGTDMLIAIAANGASKIASELSKGTRFQLYLALRVAGYHEFSRARPPVPFVADDIMETFDDGRAEQALLLLGEMAHVGQVIYLTHHGHLCDIARRVLPEVRIHALG